MSTGTALAAVTGPLLGLLIVVVAYCLGIFLSIKCCRPQDALLNAGTTMSHAEVLQPDIFIVARSEDYLVNIPRPTFIGRHLLESNQESAREIVGVAPAYEEPPSYEECVRHGLA